MDPFESTSILSSCMCVCLGHLRVFQDDCTCSEPHTIILLQSCTAFNSTAVMRPRWVRYFWQVSIFRLCQLSCTDEKNQTNSITKILISAWRVVGNLLLINVELDKNSQLFVVLINASHYLMIHLTAFFQCLQTFADDEYPWKFTGVHSRCTFVCRRKSCNMRIFFFVNCCFISICPPKKVVHQGGKAEQENAWFCIHHHNSTHFFSPCSKRSSPSLICMIREWVPNIPPPNPSDIVPNVWFLLPQLGRWSIFNLSQKWILGSIIELQ